MNTWRVEVVSYEADSAPLKRLFEFMWRRGYSSEEMISQYEQVMYDLAYLTSKLKEAFSYAVVSENGATQIQCENPTVFSMNQDLNFAPFGPPPNPGHSDPRAYYTWRVISEGHETRNGIRDFEEAFKESEGGLL